MDDVQLMDRENTFFDMYSTTYVCVGNMCTSYIAS